MRRDRKLSRRTYFLELDSLDQWPETLDLRSPRFVLFLACDFSLYSDDQLSPIADCICSQNASYACTWGPDCARGHDHIDWADIRLNPTTKHEEPIVTTTWHTDETLAEAL